MLLTFKNITLFFKIRNNIINCFEIFDFDLMIANFNVIPLVKTVIVTLIIDDHDHEACLQEISSWSSENGLSINEGKTELIHLASRHRTRSLLPPLIFNHSRLQPAKNARNLGVVIDNQLAMSIHIGKICRNAAYGLYKIGKIRPYLDQHTTERLVHAFVISHIDRCNGLLYGLPDTLICRLQRIQNSAARLITRTHSRESVSLILRNLHWLPVKDRLIFKLLVIAFKCQHKLAPLYLQQLLNEYHPIRQLRSSSRQLFVPLTVSTISYGHRAFQYAVPQLWNKLPINIKECSSLDMFKPLLKSYLFQM